ncbi:hypothetical protein ALT1644_470009 [Alteromonas macleodii]
MSALVAVGVLEHPATPTVTTIGKIRRDNCLNISFHIHIAISR